VREVATGGDWLSKLCWSVCEDLGGESETKDDPELRLGSIGYISVGSRYQCKM
jgi:hypothetical protein